MPPHDEKKNSPQTRRYIFVINNYTDDDIEAVKNVDCTAIKAGFEVGESGTPHIQGAIIFRRKKRMKGACKALGGRAHCEYMSEEATWKDQDYCLKDGDILRNEGEDPEGRSDLRMVKRDIDNGMGEHELWDVHFETMVRYGRAMKEYLDMKRRRMVRKEQTEGLWIWGPTGVGKSHEAFRDYNVDDCYVHDLTTGWWDDYCGQKVVVFNEFRGEIPFSQLLDLVDKWPKKVKRRCRESTPFVAEKLIITSAVPPDICFNCNQTDDKLDQLLRRFEVWEMKEPLWKTENREEEELDKEAQLQKSDRMPNLIPYYYGEFEFEDGE